MLAYPVSHGVPGIDGAVAFALIMLGVVVTAAAIAWSVASHENPRSDAWRSYIRAQFFIIAAWLAIMAWIVGTLVHVMQLATS